MCFSFTHYCDRQPNTAAAAYLLWRVRDHVSSHRAVRSLLAAADEWDTMRQKGELISIRHHRHGNHCASCNGHRVIGAAAAVSASARLRRKRRTRTPLRWRYSSAPSVEPARKAPPPLTRTAAAAPQRARLGPGPLPPSPGCVLVFRRAAHFEGAKELGVGLRSCPSHYHQRITPFSFLPAARSEASLRVKKEKKKAFIDRPRPLAGTLTPSRFVLRETWWCC